MRNTNGSGPAILKNNNKRNPSVETEGFKPKPTAYEKKFKSVFNY
jgi:hypothetical protein